MKRPKTAYEATRNALVKLVVDCAYESNARPRGGPKAKGWKGASRKLGIAMTTLQSVAWGRARSTTANRVRCALIEAGIFVQGTPSESHE